MLYNGLLFFFCDLYNGLLHVWLVGFAFSFHEASKSIYTMQILAVDKLVSVQVAENTAQDVAGNPNLPSDRLQVRHCMYQHSAMAFILRLLLIY